MEKEVKLMMMEMVVQLMSLVQLCPAFAVTLRIKLGKLKTVWKKNWNPLSTADSTILDRLTMVAWKSNFFRQNSLSCSYFFLFSTK